MPNANRAAIERLSKESLAGARPFPDIVAGLSAAGVGSYYADYRSGATIYYARADEPVMLPLPTGDAAFGDAFDGAALQEAIRGAQRGEVRYPEFIRRSMAAGCVGYLVWIDGAHVTYFGRRGEQHVERFPAAAR